MARNLAHEGEAEQNSSSSDMSMSDKTTSLLERREYMKVGAAATLAAFASASLTNTTAANDGGANTYSTTFSEYSQ